VIYLRHVWQRAGVAAPATVTVCMAGPLWLRTQVLEEMSQLFPQATVTTDVASDPDLAVLVLASGSGEAHRQLEWAEQWRFRARTALALYSLQPRQLEIVPVSGAHRWARVRRLTNFSLRWRRRWWRAWRWLGTRCVSFS
jgi:hypothetical protein